MDEVTLEAVRAAVRAVPAGETSTYGEIAAPGGVPGVEGGGDAGGGARGGGGVPGGGAVAVGRDRAPRGHPGRAPPRRPDPRRRRPRPALAPHTARGRHLRPAPRHRAAGPPAR